MLGVFRKSCSPIMAIRDEVEKRKNSKHLKTAPKLLLYMIRPGNGSHWLSRSSSCNPSCYVANYMSKRSLNSNIVVIAMRMPMVITTMPTSAHAGGQIRQLGAKSWFIHLPQASEHFLLKFIHLRGQTSTRTQGLFLNFLYSKLKSSSCKRRLARNVRFGGLPCALGRFPTAARVRVSMAQHLTSNVTAKSDTVTTLQSLLKNK